MKPENGIKKRIAERNNIKNDKREEESGGIRQFVLWAEEQSWQEAVDVIATRGFIRTVKI